MAAAPATVLLFLLLAGAAAARPPPPEKYSVALQGVVYCKKCELPGYRKALDASPLPGAVAMLQCGDGVRAVTVNKTTDGRGEFLIHIAAKVLKESVAKECRLRLASSPFEGCSIPVYPGAAEAGYPVKFVKLVTDRSGYEEALYAVDGTIAFAPRDVASCPHHP